MTPYIQETLKFLEETDFNVRYPNIVYVVLNKDFGKKNHKVFSNNLFKNQHLNKNKNLKFIIIFSILDAFIDSIIPSLEGESFKKKYSKIPKGNDYERILSELFRVAKVIRNAMVHNTSGIQFTDTKLEIKYYFKSTKYSVNISKEALISFYTLIIMYVKGDLGKSEYFLALARETYDHFIIGVDSLFDDIGGNLLKPIGSLRIKSAKRIIITNPEFKVIGLNISIPKFHIDFPEWSGADFSIEIYGDKLLIPQESLNSKNEISIIDAKRMWQANNAFPPIPEKP